jgi:hypothetical protein
MWVLHDEVLGGYMGLKATCKYYKRGVLTSYCIQGSIMGITPLDPSYNVDFILFDFHVLYAWVPFLV